MGCFSCKTPAHSRPAASLPASGERPFNRTCVTGLKKEIRLGNTRAHTAPFFTRFLFCFLSFSFVSFHPFPHLPPYCEASFMFLFYQGGQGEAERSISCLTTERSLFQNQQRKYCVSFWIIKPNSFSFFFFSPLKMSCRIQQ